MAYFTVTADTDLTTKGKKVASWHFDCTVAAGEILLRNGSVSGDIVVPIRIAVGASAGQSYDMPTGLYFPNGLYVDVVSGTIRGSVDLY
jgi:hypothetical protein